MPICGACQCSDMFLLRKLTKWVNEGRG
ncbi:hypothetical protein HaLaN_30333, partial [Haematococcus lacustris]